MKKTPWSKGGLDFRMERYFFRYIYIYIYFFFQFRFFGLGFPLILHPSRIFFVSFFVASKA